MGWSLLRAAGLRCVALLSLLALSPMAAAQPVIITEVSPYRGSLAGGTRLQIKGSGFSMNQGVDNIVYVGPYKCEVIPLHSTQSQIACKTGSALDGQHDGWAGWTDYLPVTVTVGGRQSSCDTTNWWGCTFSYHYGWYHTPRIYGISPRTVAEDTVITVDGRFHATPFQFEETSAPSQEVPLVSVKIVNNQPELNQPQNEPFGQSGSRCVLFNEELEEPYGYTESGSAVTQFLCKVAGGRDAGRYNLSVALLGTGMVPNTNMNMGEADLAGYTYQSDHTGTTYMLQNSPVVESIYPTQSTPTGGQVVTIKGSGFTTNASKIKIQYAGSDCVVQSTSKEVIVCALAAQNTSFSAMGDRMRPGDRGARMLLWETYGNVGLDTFKTWDRFKNKSLASVDQIVDMMEAPVNLQNAKGMPRGPWGQFYGFFRPPKSGKYTFVLATDDQSQLYVGNEELTTNTTRAISFSNWVASREFSYRLTTKCTDCNYGYYIRLSRTRRSAPFLLRQGEYRYLESFYRSHGGADNFALGAIMHDSPVNRKDQPAAIDEKQLLDLHVTTQFEVWNVTMTGSSSGTFRLQLGTKKTRPISNSASELEVAGAIREMFSNCDYQLGTLDSLELDAGGATFDCFQGRGLDYRGMAHTTVVGTECINWNETADWDPFNAVMMGLDGNLCRNPDMRSSGPWCYDTKNHKRNCVIPRCGGDTDPDNLPLNEAPYISSSFEDEEDNPFGMTITWMERNGVKPKVTPDTAFCGKNSMFFHNSFGRIRWNWRYDKSKDLDYNNKEFSTKVYPFFCMAYRIPANSMVQMLVRVRVRNSDGTYRGNYVWKTFALTNTEQNYEFAGKWNVIADDTWRYTCLDMNAAFNAISQTSNDFHFNQHHMVEDIIFYTEYTWRATYSSNPFWIDEMSISKVERQVTQTSYPDTVNSVEPKLSAVKRHVVDGGYTWQVEVTSNDCQVPDLQLSNFQIVDKTCGSCTADLVKIQDHTPALSGEISVEFPDHNGASVAWSPYATAAEVQSKVSNSVAPIMAHRSGTCQTGYSWFITFTHTPGDIAPMVVTTPMIDGKVDHTVYTMEDGGLLIGPIPSDYMHRSVSEDLLHVMIDESAAKCETEAACKFEYTWNLNPRMTLVQQSGTCTFTVTISGTSLTPSPSTDAVIVKIGGVACAVTSNSDTSIQCTMTNPLLTAGSHRVYATIPGKGFADGEYYFNMPVSVTSFSPNYANTRIASVITVTGCGFDTTLASNSAVMNDGAECTPISVNAALTTLECNLAASAGTTMTITVNSVSGSGTMGSAITPTNPSISGVSPAAGSAGGGDTITISGSSFSSTASEVTVTVGGAPCTLSSASTSQIVCVTGTGPVGSVTLMVQVAAKGIATSTFTYQLSVSSVTPTTSSLGGGNSITLVGTGFSSASADTAPVIALPGREVYLIGHYSAATLREKHEIEVFGTDSGSFTLKYPTIVNGTTTGYWATLTVQTTYTGPEMQTALRALNFHDDVIAERSVTAGGHKWTLTFNDFRGERQVAEVDASALPGVTVTARRIQEGHVSPSGQFRISLGGVTTGYLALNATSEEVKAAVEATYTTLKDVEVVSADEIPGTFLNRRYPRQWTVRFSRFDVAGLGVQRCTNPEYVDWDPNACPQTAADLYLSYYTYYWPANLPKPDDLGEESRKLRFLALCESEARSLNLVPGYCQANVPAETLAKCGEGSGVNPPCWVTRFTTANVLHQNGETVTYVRDDSNTPSDTTKGYRAWTRPDIETLREQQKMTTESTVSQYGSGVHSTLVYSRGAQNVKTNKTSISSTTVVGVLPDLSIYLQSYRDLLEMDHLYKARSMWCYADPPSTQVTLTSVSPMVGPMPWDLDSAASLDSASVSSVSLANALERNAQQFSVELWAYLDLSSGGAPLVYSVGSDGWTGYALLAKTSQLSFWIGFGASASSVVSASVSQQSWIHIGATFDGSTQKLYINGLMQASADVSSQFKPNINSPTILGGTCPASTACEGSTSWSAFQGGVDKVLWYSSAVPSGIFLAHAGVASFNIDTEARVSVGTGFSVCSGTCTLRLTTSLTPEVHSVEPTTAWDGREITVRGRQFTVASQGDMTVKLGDHTCTVSAVTDTAITCTVATAGGNSIAKPAHVSVSFSTVGQSLGKVNLMLTALVESISPSQGSLLGGTLITLNGKGFTTSVGRLAIKVGGLVCDVQSAASTQATCRLRRRTDSDQAATESVAITVDGVVATCTVSGGCLFAYSLSETPVITSVPTAVFTGPSSFIISGSSLPSDNPSVFVGGESCSSVAKSGDSVTCTMAAGAGGVYEVDVLFEKGYAASSSGKCCFFLNVNAEVTSVTPTVGSMYGGQFVTISGTGFHTTADKNLVFIGGKKAEVTQSALTSLVVKAPMSEKMIERSLETDVWSTAAYCAISQQNDPTGISCGVSTFKTCVQTLFPDYTVPDSGTTRLLFAPAVEQSDLAANLVDADAGTVWHSSNGMDKQIISFDLLTSTTVSSVTIQWDGTSFALETNVYIATDCSSKISAGSLTKVADRASSSWDSTDVISFSPQSARYVVVELKNRNTGMQDFRIQDISIHHDASVVSVVVEGAVASCSGSCSVAFDSSPRVHGVSPDSGLAGTTVNVTGQGFSSTCADNQVMIGGASCSVQSCSNSWITCTVGATGSYKYKVSVTVGVLGDAFSDTYFTVGMGLTSVTPNQGGFGPGLTLTVAGNGFASVADNSQLEICSVPCTVQSTSSGSMTCQQSGILDISSTVGELSRRSFVASDEDDATEDMLTGTLIVNAAHLDFAVKNPGVGPSNQWSDNKVYLRFTNVDVPRGAKVTQASVHLRAAGIECGVGTKIRMWIEDSDNSEPFNPTLKQCLSKRPAYPVDGFDWTIEDAWFWSAEAEESVDISHLLQKVVNRTGWAAGNAVTISLQQQRTYRVGSCNILARDYGTEFAPSLRYKIEKLDYNVDSAPSTKDCRVEVWNFVERSQCVNAMPVGTVGATASSSMEPADRNMVTKQVYTKPDTHLPWDTAYQFCLKQSATLCTQAELMEEDSFGNHVPFFGSVSEVNGETQYVPVLWYNWEGHIHRGRFVDVSTNVNTLHIPSWWWANNDANAAATKHIACCGFTGHPAFAAHDGNLESYWRSQDVASADYTLELVQPTMLSSLQIHWTDDYATKYTVHTSSDGSSWTQVSEQSSGDGEIDQISLAYASIRAKFVRVSMTERRAGSDHFGIFEVEVRGCSSLEGMESTNSSGLFMAKQSLTPTVTAVTPARGSTAGGTDVTITGTFFSNTASDYSVKFGDFDCAVQSASSSSIHCITSASGVLHGGKKHVLVSVNGYGTSVGQSDATYWYIDTWSARTTWGGAAPPTGCGSWVEDKACTDSVVIPAGQVVLLDTSLPRFYLILIEGTLILDRVDIELSASYILVKGGTFQIGTEDEPFTQNAKITMYGHPKSIELPSFGSKVIACFECILDFHGTPRQSWTSLAQTANKGVSEIWVQDAVDWPVGSKIVIASTDFESPLSSHSEIATVASVDNGGKRITFSSVTVCSTYSHSGIPSNCVTGTTLSYLHLGETKEFAGRTLEFRAEVGLLSRNIVVEGDHDDTLCPLYDTADDGVTKLSCVQFGAQLFFHSPGHESLVGRISNMEIRNGGQAFRLGRYAIHWHMVGNLRESFQKNCSIHHSWNRGTAVHGVNFLRLTGNVLYHVMGHSFFIEDGIEEYNQLIGNLGIKTLSSMNLLNTDQTPAVFWIVTGKNYILNNHAAASRRYGFWYRPEISATGTSFNTPMAVHPINIPVLKFKGNQAHSNGKYGLRIFDIFKPNAPSVFEDTFVWRNGKVGWTATVVSRVAFDGIVAVENGKQVFEGRATDLNSWEQNYVHNGFFVDYTGLPLADSYVSSEDDVTAFVKMGGPMDGGILLPWNEQAGGGMVWRNCTFVNFKNPCIRGCAHCGRGGSPVVGDGAFETRFSGMTFVNSSQRALFRHPNEAFLYDLDGTLTGSGIKEDYTEGGTVRGSSFVGKSTLLPSGKCTDSAHSTHGTGGVVCDGLIFRRMWYKILQPSEWVGKALCVRLGNQQITSTCQTMKPECNCLPWLKKAWKGNVWLAAEGYRYVHQMDLQEYELADPIEYNIKLWDLYEAEQVLLTQRYLQWDVADKYGRPLYWSNTRNGQETPINYYLNESACSSVGCGQLQEDLTWAHNDFDLMGEYKLGIGGPGNVPVPPLSGYTYRGWTFKEDADGNGGLHTLRVRGTEADNNDNDNRDPRHRDIKVTINVCPSNGCPPPPMPPEPPADETFSLWSNPRTWANTTDHKANPHNKLETWEVAPGQLEFELADHITWSDSIPSAYDDVWIPSWKKVLLDVDTPILGHLIIEGMLVINDTSTVNLDATYIEIKGGSLIIAKTGPTGNIVDDFTGQTTITLHGTNDKLSGIHGLNPRETPEIIRGKEGITMGPASIGVMGEFIARGRPTSAAWLPLHQTASAGDTEIVLSGFATWDIGSEIVITPTDIDMHEPEVTTIVSKDLDLQGNTVLGLASALQYTHYSGEESHGTNPVRTISMRGKVGLLSKNIVIKGVGEGEELDYRQWNSPLPGNPALANCGNDVCEQGETARTCAQDCRGPAYEFGASLLVTGYTEDFVYCSRSGDCTSGFRRSYSGSVEVSNVELRYFGQNNLRAGVTVEGVTDPSSTVIFRNMALNRGYFWGFEMQKSERVRVEDNVIYRAHLPGIRTRDGANNTINGNLGVVGIFWNTHRGAEQGKGLAQAKLNAMIGFIHDGSDGTTMKNNVVAGSERAGFSGSGYLCDDMHSFTGNEVMSSLSGYWIDFYRTARLNRHCTAIQDFTAWKIWLYSIYSELQGTNLLVIRGIRSADARAGMLAQMTGPGPVSHGLKDQKVLLSDSLFVGHSQNGNCLKTRPSLWTCKFYMAWCSHLGNRRSGVFMGVFMGGPNMAPLIKPWYNGGSYPAVRGETQIDGVTFAAFNGGTCSGREEFALSAVPSGAGSADAWGPVSSKNIQFSNVPEAFRVSMGLPVDKWINQADCIDMDCDGPKHALVRDEDGTFFADGSAGGAVLPRGEYFSPSSFFGYPYKDPVNQPTCQADGTCGGNEETWGQEWWYPTVPAVMRTTKQGELVNVSATWLRGNLGAPRAESAPQIKGFGHARRGCTFMAGWDGWKCPSQVSYRRVVIENMDADHEIRRVSPVAFTSDDGYTDLMNGCMDHGWCFSYTCLKRLMTFWGIVQTGTSYTIHFAATNPQSMRLHLPNAPTTEKVLLKIYYQRPNRLQVFKGGKFIEDVNLHDGKPKAQLVRDGRWAPNNGNGGYTPQELSVSDCECLIDTVCSSNPTVDCLTPSNLHGSNRFNRKTGELEIVLAGHQMDEFLEIQTMPVVQVSMALSTSVEDFYKVKDSFISNVAFLLGVNPSRISIVDVVAGNARRRNLLAAGAVVDFEIEPDAVVEVESTSVSALEDVGTLDITILRKTNVLGTCSVRYSVEALNSTAYPAVAGESFVAETGTVKFESGETSKTVTVTILVASGYKTEDRTFALSISNVVNATLGADRTVISLGNVISPPPNPISLTSATTNTISFSWSLQTWSDPPAAEYADVLEWGVQCRTPDLTDPAVSSDAWTSLAVAASESSSVFGGLTAYTKVECQVRFRGKGGWTEYSTLGSDMYTLSDCGDGARDGTEQCDDGDSASGDGCSSACTVEDGYACSGVSGGTDTCSNGCGDGTKTAQEECDDNDNTGGDGCDSACRIESGWACTGSPSDCSTVCGDSIRVSSSEACDDGDSDSLDGCSSTCTVESGFTCMEDAAMKSVCQNCGNGVLEGTEVCDDAGSSGACLSSCTSVKAGWVCSGSSCVGGPAKPAQPMMTVRTDTAISWSWTAPEGYGVAITSYTVQWLNSSDSSVVWENANGVETQAGVTSESFTAGNLTSSTSYLFRIRACSSEGCSAYSDPALPAKTDQVEASNALAAVASSATQTIASSSAVTDLVGEVNITATAPPPPPEAPAEVTDGILNETEVLNLLADELVSDLFEPDPNAFAVGFTETTPTTVSEAAGTISFTVQMVKISDQSTDHSGSGLPFTVQWNLATSNVVAGDDVESLSGSVGFLPGETSKALTITLISNTNLNSGLADKAFDVVLSSPSGGAGLVAGKTSRSVTITDDDVAPTVGFTMTSVLAKAPGSTNVSLTMSVALGYSARVEYTTSDGTAVGGTDYVSVQSGSVPIPARQAVTNFVVQTLKAPQSVNKNFVLTISAVKVECKPGDGLFLCSANLGTDSMTVAIEACGNGQSQAWEGCDDGGVVSNDGCSASCSVENGYTCSGGSTSSGDQCTALATSPPAGQAFVASTAVLEGITLAEFGSEARLQFRTGVSVALEVVVEQVEITSVASGAARRWLRKLLSNQISVDFRVVVSEAAANTMATKIAATAESGVLQQQLVAQGLSVTVLSVSTPVIATPDANGNNTTSAPSSDDDDNSNSTILIVAVVVPLVAIMCCVAAFLYLKQRRPASSSGKAKISPLDDVEDKPQENKAEGPIGNTGNRQQDEMPPTPMSADEEPAVRAGAALEPAVQQPDEIEDVATLNKVTGDPGPAGRELYPTTGDSNKDSTSEDSRGGSGDTARPKTGGNGRPMTAGTTYTPIGNIDLDWGEIVQLFCQKSREINSGGSSRFMDWDAFAAVLHDMGCDIDKTNRLWHNLTENNEDVNYTDLLDRMAPTKLDKALLGIFLQLERDGLHVDVNQLKDVLSKASMTDADIQLLVSEKQFGDEIITFMGLRAGMYNLAQDKYQWQAPGSDKLVASKLTGSFRGLSPDLEQPQQTHLLLSKFERALQNLNTPSPSASGGNLGSPMAGSASRSSPLPAQRPGATLDPLLK